MRQARKKSLFKPVEFPLTLGRDFVGEIVAVGAKVADKDLKVGDVVIGVVAPFEQGCHAEYVAVPETQVLTAVAAGLMSLIFFFSAFFRARQ